MSTNIISNLTKIWSLCLLVLIFMVITLFWDSDKVYNNNPQKYYPLIITEVTNSICTVYFVNSSFTQTHSNTIDSDCKPYLYNFSEKAYLIDIDEQANDLIIYEISLQNQLSIYKRINLGIIKITSELQFNKIGKIYFSGITNNNEQVYEVDIFLEEVIQFSSQIYTTSYNPILSSNGKFLAYLVSDGVPNNYTCLDFCNGHYLIHNLENGEIIDLSSLVIENPVSVLSNSHCQASWNPTNYHLIALMVGCYQDRQAILVFDVELGKHITTVKPVNQSLPLIDLYGWLNEEQILYSTPIQNNIDSYPLRRLHSFSIPTNHATELLFIPRLMNSGEPLELIDIALAKQDNQFAAVVYQEEDTPEIVFFEASKQNLAFSHLIGYDPIWANNNNLLGFKNATGVVVVDSSGEVIYEWVASNNNSLYQFSWGIYLAN